MSKQIYVRKTIPEDTDDYVKFALNTPDNHVDPDIFGYPRVLTLTAHNDEKNTVIMPFQTTFTLESLAVNPDATELEVAESMRQLVKTVVYEADSNGVKEIYFIATKDNTAEFASRYFEELPFRTFRLKLNSLEKAQTNDPDTLQNSN